jgi:hypothetical protein
VPRIATPETLREIDVTTLRRWTTPLAISLALLLGASVSTARAETPTEKPAGWEFQIVPYLWGAGIDGTIQVGKLPAGGVEASFEDILSNLHMAAMGAFEARKGNWGLFVDAVYVDLHDTLPTPDQVVYGEADVQLSEQLYTGLINYRLPGSDKVTVDMGWGARYYRIDTDLELTSGIAQGTTAGGKVDWWDWVAAVHVVGHPSKRWSVMGYADIGGGGSDLAWEAAVGAAFACTKVVSVDFGYRYLSIDYTHDKFQLDTAMAGPYFGVGFHF